LKGSEVLGHSFGGEESTQDCIAFIRICQDGDVGMIAFIAAAGVCYFP
jgi:hypothetical protein